MRVIVLGILQRKIYVEIKQRKQQKAAPTVCGEGEEGFSLYRLHYSLYYTARLYTCTVKPRQVSLL